jgi:hypothetical protein
MDIMTNKKTDPRVLPMPEPQLRGVFFNRGSGKGRVFKKGKSSHGLGARGFGGFSREDIEGQTRVSFPEDGEGIMESGEGFLKQFSPIGFQRREDQSDESSISSGGKPSAFSNRVTGELGGGVFPTSEEDARGGSSEGCRRGKVKSHLGLCTRGRRREIGRALGGANLEGPVGTKDRVRSRPDRGGVVQGEIPKGLPVAVGIKVRESFRRSFSQTNEAVTGSLKDWGIDRDSARKETKGKDFKVI